MNRILFPLLAAILSVSLGRAQEVSGTHDKKVATYIAILQNPIYGNENRSYAARQLCRLGGDTAMAALFKALGYSSIVGEVVARDLYHQHSAATRQKLLTLLRQRDCPQKANAASALRDYPDAEVIGTLINLLGEYRYFSFNDANYLTWHKTSCALGHMPNAKTEELLLQALESPSVGKRMGAGMAFSINKDPTALKPLVRCVNDPSGLVREKVVIAIGNIVVDGRSKKGQGKFGAYAVSALIQKLDWSANAPEIVFQTVIQLGQIQDPVAVPELRRCYEGYQALSLWTCFFKVPSGFPAAIAEAIHNCNRGG